MPPRSFHILYIKPTQSTVCDLMLSLEMSTHTESGAGFSWWKEWYQLKLGLTKTMINNARQLSRSLVGIYR